MNDVLERMGDHAVNIAQSSLFLLENPLVKPLWMQRLMQRVGPRYLFDL